MDYVDQEVRIVDVFDVVGGLRIFLVDDSPSVQPDVKGLLLPDLEGLIVNNSRLDNFFIAEHSPSNSIHIIVFYVLELLSSGVTCLVTDHVVFL